MILLCDMSDDGTLVTPRHWLMADGNQYVGRGGRTNVPSI